MSVIKKQINILSEYDFQKHKLTIENEKKIAAEQQKLLLVESAKTEMRRSSLYNNLDDKDKETLHKLVEMNLSESHGENYPGKRQLRFA